MEAANDIVILKSWGMLFCDSAGGEEELGIVGGGEMWEEKMDSLPESLYGQSEGRCQDVGGMVSESLQ